MVPGIGGSGRRRWQTLWQQEFTGQADRIQPVSWEAPDQSDWLEAISRAAGSDTVIVAHSLGCLAAATWLTQREPIILGAFLVAPPDPKAPSFPPAATSFTAPSTALPVPSVVLASSDDPFSSFPAVAAMARNWDAALLDIGPLGHVNSASDLGQWNDGRERLQTFIDHLGSHQGEDTRR
jgi:hypothetical protein